MAADTRDRARAYLAKMPPAIAGQGGHDAAFSAAVAMVRGFELPEAEALALLREEYNPRCSPPWTDKELHHKVQDAAQGGDGAPPLGYLLDGEDRNHQWRGRRRAPPVKAPPPRDWRAAAVLELPPKVGDWPPSWREAFEERATMDALSTIAGQPRTTQGNDTTTAAKSPSEGERD